MLCLCLWVHKWFNLLKCVMFTINIEKVMNFLQFIQMLHVSFVIDSRFWSSLSTHQLWRCLCKSSSCILCGPLVIDSVTLGPFRITGLIFILYFFTYLATNFQVYYYLCLCLASGRQSILMSYTLIILFHQIKSLGFIARAVLLIIITAVLWIIIYKTAVIWYLIIMLNRYKHEVKLFKE